MHLLESQTIHHDTDSTHSASVPHLRMYSSNKNEHHILSIPSYYVLLLIVILGTIHSNAASRGAVRKHHHEDYNDYSEREGDCESGFGPGSRNSSKLRVIGGRQALPGEFPFTVRITKDRKTTCTGSIIDERNILTAAHCVVKQDSEGNYQTIAASRLEVVAGDYNSDWEGDSQRYFRIQEVIPHREYADYGPYTVNDIALLKTTAYITEEKLPQWQPGQGTAINRVELPGKADLGTVMMGNFQVAGWGAIGFNPAGKKIMPRFLYTLETQLVDCSHPFVTSTNKWMYLCTKNANAGVCAGDSGGPLFMKWRDDEGSGRTPLPQYRQFGISVFVPDGCARGLTYYMNLSAYTHWINDAIIYPQARGNGNVNVTREEEALDDDQDDG